MFQFAGLANGDGVQPVDMGFQNRCHMVSRVRQNPDKRKPEQNQQVHDQEDASDTGFAGFGCAGADVVEIVTVPALTKLALNGDALAVVLLSLASVYGVFGRCSSLVDGPVAFSDNSHGVCGKLQRGQANHAPRDKQPGSGYDTGDNRRCPRSRRPSIPSSI